MKKINLPPLNWFIQEQNGNVITNTYSGSLGTDGKTGCLSSLTFNFRVFAELLGDEYKFIVLAFVNEPWPNNDRVIEDNAVLFDTTCEGVAEAQKWLCDTAAKYGF